MKTSRLLGFADLCSAINSNRDATKKSEKGWDTEGQQWKN